MANEQVGSYQSAMRQGLTPREVEAMALTKAATMLEDARKNPENYDNFAQALRLNHLL
ncbi:MAG: flagellar protein FlaF [Rhodospirillaceae bacterium]|nr:MAG: flagellar protein FlaF [Rhodospirillaceae bacterium]